MLIFHDRTMAPEKWVCGLESGNIIGQLRIKIGKNYDWMKAHLEGHLNRTLTDDYQISWRTEGGG